MMYRFFIPLIFSLTACLSGSAQSVRYDSLWANPAVEERIRQGIETHRKGDFTLTITSREGKPLKNATVEIRQVRHEFLFGANLFMLDGFKSDTANRRYEEAFLSLFNHGSVPFYWKALEPEPGNVRFAAGSVPIYRRPPPDVVLAFCEKHGVYPKGHTLVWDNPQWAVPTWLPNDTAAIQPLIDRRIDQIAERYGQRIQMWDVVNELKNRHMHVPMPYNFALKAFRRAAGAFPTSAILMLNETTSVWYDRKGEYSQYFLNIENLLLKGARIDAIGLQCHFFHGEQEYRDVLAGRTMQPTAIFDVLDTYARFGKPLHITEVTIPTVPNTAEGQQAQAAVARNLYRLWFSHPGVRSIVWWNVADGTATPDEDKWLGGFLGKTLQPKPSYHTLDRLINQEWKTVLTMQPKETGPIRFRGFYGEYVVRIRQGKKITEQRVNWRKGQPNSVQLAL